MNYYIRQIGEKDCGFASLKMLLANIYKKKDFLFYPQNTKNTQLSLKEIIELAKKEGVTLKGYRYDKSIKEDLFKEDYKNGLLVLKISNQLHMVEIRKIRKNSILVNDPKYGSLKFKKKDFIELWTGDVLLVENVDKTSFSLINKKPTHSFFKILSVISTVLSFCIFGAALYFIDEKANFLLPLGLFFSYFFANFLIEKIVQFFIKRFDNNIWKNIDFSKDSRSNIYSNIMKYKTSEFTFPIRFTSNLMISILAIFILSLNSYLNIISIFIILFTLLILEVAFKNIYKVTMLKITIKENDAISGNKTDFIKGVNEASSLANKLININAFKRYFMILIIMILSLFLTSFQETISLNFLLFHFFIYIYLYETFDKNFKLNEEYEKLKELRNIYYFYTNFY